MPKFYVQSGDLEIVTTAASSRCAAIWAVHRAMSPALPFLSDGPAEETAGEPSLGSRLADTIHVSEQGFDRDDGDAFETLDVLTEWNQLLVAIDRLEERLEAVGV